MTKEITRKLQKKIAKTYGLALPNIDKLIEELITKELNNNKIK